MFHDKNNICSAKMLAEYSKKEEEIKQKEEEKRIAQIRSAKTLEELLGFMKEQTLNQDEQFKKQITLAEQTMRFNKRVAIWTISLSAISVFIAVIK